MILDSEGHEVARGNLGSRHSLPEGTYSLLPNVAGRDVRESLQVVDGQETVIGGDQR